MANLPDIAALYRRYGSMVLQRCRTILGSEADAQEAAQIVFLQLHRYRETFRGDAAPSMDAQWCVAPRSGRYFPSFLFHERAEATAKPEVFDCRGV